jgi:hypothetical protein
MKTLLSALMLMSVVLAGCAPEQDGPEQGTRPVGDAGGTDQTFGTNPINDPAGNIQQAPVSGTNEPVNR